MKSGVLGPNFKVDVGHWIDQPWRAFCYIREVIASHLQALI